jgi:hypothetical protein
MRYLDKPYKTKHNIAVNRVCYSDLNTYLRFICFNIKDKNDYCYKLSLWIFEKEALRHINCN